MNDEQNIDDVTKITWGSVVKKCISRFKIKIYWYADPDGPSFLKDVFNLILWVFGAITILIGAVIVLDILTIKYISHIYFSTFSTDIFLYLGSVLIFIGGTLFVKGKHLRIDELSTGVYNDDIDILLCDANKFEKYCNENIKNDLINEINILKKLKEMPSEVSYLRFINLKIILVDSYTNTDKLIAAAESDLQEYAYFISKDDDNYREYEYLIKKQIHKNNPERLKEHLRILREKIQWEAYLAGKGEAILKSLTHWSFPAITSLFIIGLVPLTNSRLIEQPYSLYWIHWAVLGMAGAILFTVSHMKKMDEIKVGEDEGNLVLRRTLLGMLIGFVSAILLYVAAQGCIIGGRLFPQFCEGSQIPLEQHSLSIFWAVISGYSAKFLDNMVGKSQIAT